MAFAFATGDLLIEVNRDGVVTYATGASKAVSGLPAEELLGRPIESLAVEGDRALLRHLARVLPAGARRGPLMIEVCNGESIRPVTLHAFRPSDRADFISLSFAAGACDLIGVNDLIDRDLDTGLLRAETFAKLAEDLLDRANGTANTLSVTQIGIPGLAELSAKHGTDAVRTFISEAAAVLRSYAYGDAATKLGEGKYALLHDASVSGENIASEIESLSKPDVAGGQDMMITHQKVAGSDQLGAEDATRALIYTINEFASSTDGPVAMDTLNAVIESRLSAAVDRITWFKKSIIEQDLHFVGQPIVWLSNAKVHHAEVLVRFQSNQSPFAHLQFAEKVGIIHELDLSVLEYVVAYLASAERTLPLAVNVSATSFERSDFVVKLLRLLEQRVRNPSMLLFEVTESAEIRSIERTNRILQGLRERGHKVCLDDFGAGAASFQYLRGLDVDMVKIDGHYVKTAMQSRKEAEMLRAIARLCHQLRIVTVAEQVESEAQADYLREVGVDLAQGYLFGKPQPLDLQTYDMPESRELVAATAGL